MAERLVMETDHAEPAHNLAVDEALLRAVPPTALLWTWQNSPSVVIGRGQRIEREVDVAAAASDGVPVLRRCSGGGTVYHDLGNLNVTLVLPGQGDDALRLLGEVVHNAVRSAGFHPEITKRGLFVRGAKLSGFAAFRTKHGSLAHATVLVRTPAEHVTRYLLPEPAHPHPLDSQRSPVAALAEHGSALDVEAVDRLVSAATRNALGQLRRRSPSTTELGWRDRLLRTRYGNTDWHLTGKGRADPAEEEMWTRRPEEISTARWC